MGECVAHSERDNKLEREFEEEKNYELILIGCYLYAEALMPNS